MSPQDRELMQQALDALQNSGKDCGKTGKRAAEFLRRKVCDALRARLAEPETPAPTLFRVNLLRLCPELTHAQIDELAAMASPAARKVQPLTEGQILKAIRGAVQGDTLRLTRDVGPYEVTQPTYDAIKLVQAIELALGITGDTE